MRAQAQATRRVPRNRSSSAPEMSRPRRRGRGDEDCMRWRWVLAAALIALASGCKGTILREHHDRARRALFRHVGGNVLDVQDPVPFTPLLGVTLTQEGDGSHGAGVVRVWRVLK